MRVYLDNSATTAMAAEVIEVMLPCFDIEFGNALSVHSFGQRAKSIVEVARREVAALINAAPSEIVFVAGGTEADNFAIRGIAEAHRERGNHIITGHCTGWRALHALADAFGDAVSQSAVGTKYTFDAGHHLSL